MELKNIKEWMQDNLRKVLLNDYEYLLDYFETIKNRKADYTIFISRRCYILYQMFAFIFEWKENNVISDRGMWCNRGGLREAGNVVIADDMMLSGASIKSILTKLEMYLNENCIKQVVVFCRCNNCQDEVNNHQIKSYCVRTVHDCTILTDKLVKSIQSNGIPYAVFVYPVYGVVKKQKNDIWNKLKVIKNKDIFNSEQIKWDTQIYFDFIDEIKILQECLCDEVCLRVYKKKEDDLICIIPFAFLKNVKKAFIKEYFIQIKECFEGAGGVLFAEEIISVLDGNAEKFENEKYTYLASLIVCYLSKILGVLFDMETLFEEKISAITDNIILGSFSYEIVNELDRIDKDFAKNFITELSNRAELIKECVQAEDENNITSYNFYYNDLIESEDGKKECEDVLVDLFHIMRLKFNEGGSEQFRYIYCDEIASLLKSKFTKREIHASEINVWDQGIATYDFCYDNIMGLRSRCGIGERSALIFSLKYQSELNQFFKQLPYGNGNIYTQEQQNSDIKQILNRNSNLSDLDKDLFFEVAQSGIINLYNYCVEI